MIRRYRSVRASPWRASLMFAIACSTMAAVADALPPLSTTLQPIVSSASTGEKPQSKVWQHAGSWWSVIPDASGTWLRRLDGSTWTNQLQLSSATSGAADVRAIGDVAHILLYRGVTSELASVQYLSGPNTYQPWPSRPTLATVSLDSGVETATIDVDSQGRMWLASDGSTTISVRYSDAPYSSWSSPVVLATGVTSDDISAVTALPNGTVGVLWSNQSTQRFGFRLHVDGDAPGTWAADEVPASQSALNVGLGMADDHLHVAVASDATLYAAVKTSYDATGYPKIALLVRRPGGTWDDLYPVDTSGTRAIVLLNENAGTISVVYTSTEGAGDIVYRESSTSPIAFGSRSTLIGGLNHNDVTSTKQNITDQAVLLAKSTSASAVDGVLRSMPPTVCGDGLVAASEGCDDGDLVSGDGCSSGCNVEPCFACAGQPSSCVPNTGASCDDGVFCNGADTCSAGAACVHAGNPCPGADGDGNCSESCDEAADNCGAADPNGSGCNDALYCNGADTCGGGACSAHVGSPCPGPDGDGNCTESCNEAADNCSAMDPNGSGCSDGLFCNGADTCSSGACSSHAGSPCQGPDGDGNCSESCNEAADDCTAADVNGSVCNDGSFCTATDACVSGGCVGSGDPCVGGPECNDSCDEAADGCADPVGTECADDGNVCTDDACNGAGVCVHANNAAACNDGLFCTAVDTCASGACIGVGDPCAGGPECDDSCDELADSCAEPAGTGCASDGNVCTDDECDGTGACAHVANTEVCDDGVACTVVDVCVAGGCVGGTPPQCDDGNPCTQDSCDDGSGCLHVEEPAPLCRTALRSSLRVRDDGDDSKDQLRWKWQRGAQTVQGELGDPSLTTTYTLCVYDTSGGAPTLSTFLKVDPNVAWESYDPRGWRLSDKGGVFDGVQQLKLAPGEAGRSKAQLKARGINLPTPSPFDATVFFDQSPRVVVQLFNSEGMCFGSEFTTSRKNTGTEFKANAP